MSAPFTARDRVAIAGFAQSPIERRSASPLGVVAIETARRAIADAGLAVSDIDGFIGSALLPSAGDHAAEDGVSTVTAGWLAQNLGADPGYVANFQGFGQIPGIMAMAVNAVASGACRNVVIHRALHNPAGSYHGNSTMVASGAMQWVMPHGFFGPLSMIGLTFNEYAQRYGATRETLARVVVEARRHGSVIPWSYWHNRPLTLDEYLESPLLSDPICKLDCDLPIDGAAAFVITSTEHARDLPHRPVTISGFAASTRTRNRVPLHWPLEDLMDAGTGLAKRLWRMADVNREDVDLPQLYDGFSPFVPLWLEVLGYAPVGEAHRFILDGGIEADTGGVPVLSGGGALGNGRMHGIPQLLECYLQLSGRAAERQRHVSVGLACHASPHLGGAVVLRRDA